MDKSMRYMISSSGHIFGVVLKDTFTFKEDYLKFFGYSVDDDFDVYDEYGTFYCSLSDVSIVSQEFYRSKFC